MNKMITIILFTVLFPTILSAQNKQDYHWIFGNDKAQGEAFISFHIDFNTVPFEVGTRDAGLTFNRNNASVADREGNLLFYTNGCAVAGADHELLMNGDSINAGPFYDELWLGDCINGYPGRQDITILDDPANTDGYFIIHKTIEYDASSSPASSIRYLKYSYVNMSGDNGKGAVEEKNTVFYDSYGNGILSSYLSTIRHENQKDWWILQPLNGENEFLTVLLTENGFEKIDTQEIARPFDAINSSASGSAHFSSDGKNYAYYNKHDGLHVYDFDRETGLLSNPRSLYTAPPEGLYFSTLEFSPDSELLYYMTQDSLWQVDLTYDDLSDGKVFIEEWNGIEDPFATNFFLAALAPDCRIYIRSGSSTQSVHVINKPNERGVACDFVQQGIQFPFTNARGGWPNSPRWRVDDEEKCDSSIVSIFGELVYYRRDLKVFPNPSTGPLTIELPEDQREGYLSIVDASGQSIFQKEIIQLTDTYQTDLSLYPSGIYYIEYMPKQNKELRVYTAKVILE